MNERVFGLGVDLGTSNSAISRVDISSGRPEFMDAKDLGGDREIPSVVYFHPDGAMEFGHVAAQRARLPSDADRVLTNVKLLLRSNEPIVVPGLASPVEPKQIIRGMLAHLKSCAERTFATPCTRAVISVPAHEEFDVDYRARVREAAMEGEPLFQSISTIPEPDSVLMSIGDLQPLAGRRVLVFDMGGGTLDVSIRDVEMRDGHPFLTQLAVVGSDAAGRRVTQALIDHMIDKWEKDIGFTFSTEEREQAIRINFTSIDDAKRHLSSMIQQHGADSPRAHSCIMIAPRGKHEPYSVSVQAKVLTKLCEDVCADAIVTVERALARAGCTAEEIDDYFVVGGSSRLPLMQERLVQLFRKSPSPLMGPFGTIDSTLAVVRGAAVDDLERAEQPAVPMTAPVLERRLPYAISMVTDSHEATKTLVPENAPLPFGPVEETFYVKATGDQEVSIVLVRGEGPPDGCPIIAPNVVTLLEPAYQNDPLAISWFIDESGEMIVQAFDKKKRELAVIRTFHD